MSHEPPASFDQLSRRRLFATAACAAAAASPWFGWSSASAQDQKLAQGAVPRSILIPKKSAKFEVDHRSPSNSWKLCKNCRLFVAPDQCVVVEGWTTADSSCALWADNSRRLGCSPDQTIPL